MMHWVLTGIGCAAFFLIFRVDVGRRDTPGRQSSRKGEANAAAAKGSIVPTVASVYRRPARHYCARVFNFNGNRRRHNLARFLAVSPQLRRVL